MSVSITLPILNGKTRTSNFLSTTDPSNTYIVVSVIADRQLTLVVNQAHDDKFFDKVDTFGYTIPNEEFNYTIKRVGTKANFTLTNSSGEDCTYTRAFGSYREGNDSVIINGGFIDVDDPTTHTKLDEIVVNTSKNQQTADDVETIKQTLQNEGISVSDADLLNQVELLRDDVNAGLDTFKFSQSYASLSTDVSLLGADSVPQFDRHPTLSGWRYTNAVEGGASNLYFYGLGINNAFQRTIEVSDLKNFFVKGRILNLINTNSIPFVSIYTRPTGSGDAGSFFKSRITYRIAQTPLAPAEEFVMFFERDEAGAGLNSNVFRNVARKNMVEIARLGAGLDTEQVFLLSINTDSGASPNTVEVVYSGAGYTAFGQTNVIELSDYREDKSVSIIDFLKLLGEKLDGLGEKLDVIAENTASGSGGDGGGTGGTELSDPDGDGGDTGGTDGTDGSIPEGSDEPPPP
jgi:hypothetical protein